MTSRPLTAIRPWSEFRGERPACAQCVLRRFCAPAGPVPLRTSGFAQRPAQKGMVLYQQGESVERIWTVCHGGVKLVHSDSSGNEDILAVLGPGVIFGHDEILEGMHRNTAAVIQDGMVASMRRDAVLLQMEQDADFSRSMYAALAHWSEQLARRATDASRGTSRQRLARLLLRLADQFGAPTPEGTRIAISLQRREIAGLIALEPETVTRLMSGLFEDGVVRELRRGEFLLLDAGRLHRMAHV